MTFAASLVTGLAALALVFVGIVLWRTRMGAVDPRLGPLQAERDRLAAELAAAQARARDDAEAFGRAQAALDGALRSTQELDAARALADRLREELSGEKAAHAGAVRELETRRGELAALQQSHAALQAEAHRLGASLAQAQANLAHAHKAEAEMRAFIEDAQAKLSASFAQMAGKVFEERGAQFEANVRTATVQSKADIETLLKPFSEQLNQFRQRVDAVYGEEAKERASLVGALGELRRLNEDMAAQAHALTRALKGNAKVRGDWGELMLESVLRGSGLEDGVHFERQKSMNDESGRAQRPDVVVRLPGDRCVVVDSKVNLIAWEQAMNADDVDAHHEALHRHAIALRQHVRELSDKQYPKLFGEAALDVTVAFVPIEGALSAALGTDGSLQTYAFERRIVFASPNTLMALLRVVDGLWTREKIQKQAEEINKAGGLLLEALTGFLNEFERVGTRLQAAADTYADAKRRLSDSTMAVIPRARRLVSLGVKPKAKLPEMLAPDVDTEIESVGQSLLLKVTESKPGDDASR